ncbi:MAG TPA: hypothetical protein PKU71_04705 [bacterium]|nr:hypothetical protein [bacterium]
MFETIVDGIYEQIRQKMHTDQNHWSYFELTGKGSDEVVRKIFTGKYEQIFRAEKARIVAARINTALPYGKAPVDKALDILVDELKREWLIPKTEVEQTLRESLLLRLQYITMPLATVESLMFADTPARTIEEIVNQYRVFEIYKYYPDALERYAKAKAITHLNKIQLRLLINEINQSLFGKDALENVLKLCGLVMKEVNELRGASTNTIEIGLLMKAFADRSLRDFEVALNIEKELGNEQINIYGLRQVLNRFVILKEKKAVAAEKTIVNLAPKSEPSPVESRLAVKPKDTTDLVIDKVRKDEESGEIIDLNAILSHQPSKEKTDELRPKPKEPTVETIAFPADMKAKTGSTKIKFAPETVEEVTGEFIKEELVQGFSDDTQTIRLKDIKESDNLVLLQSVITPKDEQIFMKSIFGGDEAYYRDFVSQVNRSKTWKEAITVVDDMLFEKKVDPYCKEAIRLSDVVYMRYYPPEKNNG